MKDSGTFEPSNRDVSETHRPRRMLRSIGAVLAGLLAIIILSSATDIALHATGVFLPSGQPMADALFLLATAYRIVYRVAGDRKSTRLNSSHANISYAVFCLKKKKKKYIDLFLNTKTKHRIT